MKMPADGSTKHAWGGERPGAGRPPSDLVRIRVTVNRTTAAILERIAKQKGLSRRKGAPPFLGAAVDELASRVSTPEPEYLRIARELRERANLSCDGVASVVLNQL